MEPLSNAQNPQCLFPVGNIPNINFVIEFLLMNQVKHIIISTKSSRDLLVKKTEQYKNQCKLKIVSTPEAENFGDSLRSIASMDVIGQDDFIVVRGDIITNINIHEALKMHYFIKKEESKKENMDSEKSRKVSTIMTKLFLKMSYTDPLRDPNTDVTMMVDK